MTHSHRGLLDWLSLCSWLTPALQSVLPALGVRVGMALASPSTLCSASKC